MKDWKGVSLEQSAVAFLLWAGGLIDCAPTMGRYWVQGMAILVEKCRHTKKFKLKNFS